MIDAYEIGIQLALQDGVSAGLETIGRELAEVDRAIAATTAGLQGLTIAAQAASRDAAAAGITRPVVTIAHSAAAIQTGPEMTGRQGKQQAPAPGANSSEPKTSSAAVATPREGTPASPSFNAAVPQLALTQAVASDVTGRVSAPPSPSPSAPSMTVQQRLSITQAPTHSTMMKGLEASLVEPSVAPARLDYNESLARAVPAGLQGQESASPPHSARHEQVITASVSNAVASPSRASINQSSLSSMRGDRDPVPAQPQAPAPEQVQLREAAAAWAGASNSGRVPTSMANSGIAAAPQPQSRDGGTGMTGTVMLDGRLVGYWLSEQMAREASKPPGGTTFFDPRQSPAWNASGAL